MELTGLLQVAWLSTLLLCADGLWQPQFTHSNLDTSLYKDCLLCTDMHCPHCAELYPVSEDAPTDLGTDHYPRFVKEVSCDVSRCEMCTAPFRCQAVLFPVPFLVRRKEQEAQDFTVPTQLRAQWKFEEVHLSVGCTCTA